MILASMSYDARTRDRYRGTVSVMTGVVGATAITATGWVAGVVAQDAQEEAAKQATSEATAQQGDAGRVASPDVRGPRPRTVLRQRPIKTRVTLRYVTAASGVPGVGGTVSAGPTQTRPAPAPHAAPAPPPAPPQPPPPPAPSNGS
jgi:hypothetical protein